ncbi:MAG: response regulator [Candidatus Limiplasma sp.]|nr:response regulator [Candidatus Limiplasma sp.]
MNTVIIVDDEKIIREGLARVIQDKCPGFQVVGEAADGDSALKLTRALRPQVAIVDIRMPVMGGIDYMRIASQEPSPPRFIVLTGYADFEYARQIIGLGCEGYLLKPLKHKELTELMGKIAAALAPGPRPMPRDAHEAGQCREDALRGLAMGCEVDEETLQKSGLECLTGRYHLALLSVDGVAQLRRRLSSSGMDPQLRGWYAIPEIVSQAAREQAGVHTVVTAMTDRTTALLLSAPQGTPLAREQVTALVEAVRKAVEEATDLSITLGISGPHQGASAYPLAADQCTCAVGYRFYSRTGQTFWYDKARPLSALPDGYEMEKAALSALDMGDGEGTARWVGELMNRLKEIQVRKSTAVMVLSKLYVEMVNLLDKKGMQSILRQLPPYDEFETLLAGRDLFEEVREQMERTLETLARLLSQDQVTGSKKTVRLAMKYVQDNMDKPMGTNEAAQHLTINASYFSVLFKRETGENFINYVNRVKIERAKTLLREPMCKVYEVCEQVGYEDSKYFARLFRKLVGMTPSQYREGAAQKDGKGEREP